MGIYGRNYEFLNLMRREKKLHCPGIRSRSRSAPENENGQRLGRASLKPSWALFQDRSGKWGWHEMDFHMIKFL